VPSAPAKLCSKPGCRGVVRDGTCSVCGPVKAKTGWRDDRGTRQERGYDKAWRAVRAEAIRRNEERNGGVCVCVLCGEPIWNRKEIHADHVVPFCGLGDPLRLDVDNVAVQHFRCHMRKTAKQRRTGQTE